MHRKKYFKILAIRQRFGIHGELRYSVEKDEYESIIENLKHLFVEIDGQKLPYFIESINLDRELIKFEGINNPEDALILSNGNCYVNEDQVDFKQHEKSIVQDELIGFVVYNQDGTQLGEITSLTENFGQILAEVKTKDDAKFLLPIAEAMILSIDQKINTITLEVPEGLLDL